MSSNVVCVVKPATRMFVSFLSNHRGGGWRRAANGSGCSWFAGGVVWWVVVVVIGRCFLEDGIVVSSPRKGRGLGRFRKQF
ncbi:UNVERIFIED_CONTAM: hypothetical protein Sangu_2432900 [Sesamum angustifolium]|uniref:Uncharacterized protein n=1 Tax=Sesamum angustifolium TaxID=2727405 RepID=A0AAW2KXT1_9LAMI